jgi:hypothetical protein
MEIKVGDILRCDGDEYLVYNVEAGNKGQAKRDPAVDPTARHKFIDFSGNDVLKASGGELYAALLQGEGFAKVAAGYKVEWVAARSQELTKKFAGKTHEFLYLPGRIMGRPNGTTLGELMEK